MLKTAQDFIDCHLLAWPGIYTRDAASHVEYYMPIMPINVSYLCLQVGTNNIHMGQPIDGYCNDIVHIIQLLHGKYPQTQIFVMANLPRLDQIECFDYTEALKLEVQKHNIHYCCVLDFSSDFNPDENINLYRGHDVISDVVHLSYAGTKKLYELLTKAVREFTIFNHNVAPKRRTIHKEYHAKPIKRVRYVVNSLNIDIKRDNRIISGNNNRRGRINTKQFFNNGTQGSLIPKRC